MRVGILTQWYEPEPGGGALPGVLARGLMARGHSVRVVTGFPNYPNGVIAPGYRMRRWEDGTCHGVNVRRVALYPNHGTSAIGRIANYLSFASSATLFGIAALRGADAIWVYNSPITIAIPMWATMARWNIPAVVHIMDLWPESIVLSGFGGQQSTFSPIVRTIINAWCTAMHDSASYVAYTAPSVGEVLESRGIAPDKLRYIPVWANESIYGPSAQSLRAELDISETAIVLLYAGAIGDAQGLATLIDACPLVHDERFVCLIAGSGNSEAQLCQRAQNSGPKRARFIGRFTENQMTALMATSDINYIGLRSQELTTMTIPSKTQAALASGRALLVSANGDIAKLAVESGAGWAVDPGDAISLANAIDVACAKGRDGLKAMGEFGRIYYQKKFSVDRGVEAVEALLQLASGRRRDHD